MSNVFDKILSGTPVNKDAAKIARGGGVHFEPIKNITQRHWSAPPRLPPRPALTPDLTGIRFGRFTVIGYFGKPNPKGQALWLVRCICGDYETRKSQAIRNPENSGDRCDKCCAVRHLKRQEIRDRTGKWPDRSASSDF